MGMSPQIPRGIHLFGLTSWLESGARGDLAEARAYMSLMNRDTRWALRFWAIAMGISLALIAVFLIFGPQWLDLSVTAMVALCLGILFSVAIGAGLMALVFVSSRSGADDLPRRED
jgi:hypothetical protein